MAFVVYTAQLRHGRTFPIVEEKRTYTLYQCVRKSLRDFKTFALRFKVFDFGNLSLQRESW